MPVRRVQAALAMRIGGASGYNWLRWMMTPATTAEQETSFQCGRPCPAISISDSAWLIIANDL